MTMTTTAARHDQLSELRDPFAAPGALTGAGVTAIFRGEGVRQYWPIFQAKPPRKIAVAA